MSMIPVTLEVGTQRTFASALEWPGWSRSGRGGEEAALGALRAHAPRYAVVARAAGLEPPDPAAVEVVERLDGSASTDFGVPGAISPAERGPLSAAQAVRLIGILEGCWDLFERVAAAAPAALRKGPRGGGRDRDPIVEHVLGAEAEAYARKIGLRLARPALDDLASRAAQRRSIVAALHAAADTEPGDGGAPRGWPPRYAVRRMAWHVLDHAWEIEDRSAPAPDPPDRQPPSSAAG